MRVTIDSLIVDPDPERNWNPEVVGKKVVAALREGNEVLVTNVRDIYLSVAYQFSVIRLVGGAKATCDEIGDSLLFKLVRI